MPVEGKGKYMNASVCFEQKGIIESVNNHLIGVRIDRESACGNCNALRICNLGATKSYIEVPDSSNAFSVGEWVDVTITRGMGNKAIFLGYFIPFVILISSLVILTASALPEWLAGLISILALVPYYIILYTLRNRLKRTFTFSIHKTR
jgi:positive regulator of sigma E activity